jgi:hypothetical protein
MPYGSRRVSTDAQQTALQRAALKQAGCITTVTDEGLAGAMVQRPALTRCLAARRPWWSHPRCVRDAPPQRCASTGEGDPCRVQRVRSPVQGQPPPTGLAMQLSQGHNRQSLSSAGLIHWYRLGAARVFQGDCHEGEHGTRPTRRCQPHFHLPPRLLWDTRAIIGPAWRRGPFVQVVPQRRARWSFCGKSLFLSRTSFLHSLCQTPASTVSLHGCSGGRLRGAVCSAIAYPLQQGSP